MVVFRVENAEDLGGEVVGDDTSHAREAGEEERERVFAVELERGASAFGCIGPRVDVVEHVDQYDAQ